jgi:hypothetical protein
MARDNWGSLKAAHDADNTSRKDTTKEEKQFATPSDGDPSGGNMSGGVAQKQPIRLTVAAFQGRSGQPDNQSTDRGKGST